jgi:hypothetical protein
MRTWRLSIPKIDPISIAGNPVRRKRLAKGSDALGLKFPVSIAPASFAGANLFVFHVFQRLVPPVADRIP